MTPHKRPCGPASVAASASATDGRHCAAQSPAGTRRLLRYAAVGLLATASHWVLLVLLVELAAWPAWWASGAGAVLGAQVAFVGNRHCTFAYRGAAGPAWWRFQATAAVGAVLGVGVVAVTVRWGGHYLLAQALATLLVLLFGFGVNQRWSFASPDRA